MTNRRRLPLKSTNITSELVRREFEAVRDGKWLEAVSLQMWIIELLLRGVIRKEVRARLVRSEKETEHYGDCWNDEKFSRLVHNYFLLGGPRNTVNDLKSYSKKRARVIHELDTFNSLVELDLFAETTYKLGDVVFESLTSEFNQAAFRANQVSAIENN